MLEIRNLNIQVTKDDHSLVNDLSFVLNKNDKFAVIGLEGNGKSTLLKAIYDNALIPYTTITGTIDSSNSKLGYLPQSITENWSNTTVYDYLLKKKHDSIIEQEDYLKLNKLSKVLGRVKFNLKLLTETKLVSEYSGGEIVKLGLAKILLDEPDILLLDEPTNDLDLETILFLEDFILNEERPILFISHDEALLENTTNGIIHLTQTHKKTKAITIVSKTSYNDYKSSRIRSLDSEEMIARKQRSDYKIKMRKYNKVFSRVEHLQNQAVRNPTTGRLLAKKMKSLKSTSKRLLKEKDKFIDIPEREEAIDIYFDTNVSIPLGKTVINITIEPLTIKGKILSKKVDLLIKGNKKLAIIGMNGSGKTTFLKEIYNQNINRDDISIGYMSQNYEDVFIKEETALQFLLTDPDKLKETRIRKMMGALHFTREEMINPITSLSGGQKAKLLFLKMVIDKNNVLLLDEPTRNLSPLSSPIIHNLLLNFKGSIICITHDRTFIENVFDEVYVLDLEGLKKIS